MKSNNLHQLDLPIHRDMQAVDMSVINQQRTFTAAIKLCISLSGFDSEKQIYMTLGIDPGHWTRISKGDAHFPQEKLEALMDICGNEVPLIWLADARGYELKPLQTELEKENAELKEKVRQMEEAEEIKDAQTTKILKSMGRG